MRPLASSLQPGSSFEMIDRSQAAFALLLAAALVGTVVAYDCTTVTRKDTTNYGATLRRHHLGVSPGFDCISLCSIPLPQACLLHIETDLLPVHL